MGLMQSDCNSLKVKQESLLTSMRAARSTEFARNAEVGGPDTEDRGRMAEALKHWLTETPFHRSVDPWSLVFGL